MTSIEHKWTHLRRITLMQDAAIIFPFTQFLQCHWLQTVNVQGCSWCCTPCSDAVSHAVPFPTLACPKTGGYRWHTLPRHTPVRPPTLPGISYACPPAVTSANLRRDPPALSCSRLTVLSALSIGARLRRALTILPFQTWRRVLFH